MTKAKPNTNTQSGDEKTKPSRAWFWTMITVSLAVVGVVGAMAWWVIGNKVWTDDRSIRVNDSNANLREVLWTKPQQLNKVFKSDQFNTKDHEYEPSTSPDGTEMYFVRGLAGNVNSNATSNDNHNDNPADDSDNAQNIAAHTDIFVSYRRNNKWTQPKPLASINTSANELGPRLSADGEHLFFYSDRKGGVGGYDIWAAPRTETGFGKPINLEAINSIHNEFNPAPSPDGRILFFTTNRIAAAQHKDDNRWHATIRHNPAATDYDLFVAEFESIDNSNTIDGTIKEAAKKLDLDATAIDQIKTNAQSNPQSKQETSEQPQPIEKNTNRQIANVNLTLSAPIEVPGLNSDFHEGAGCLTPGGDFFYFASNRPHDDRNDFDLYRCRIRPISQLDEIRNDDPIAFGLHFGEIESIKELNTIANETDPQLAMGGFQLLFSSDLDTDIHFDNNGDSATQNINADRSQDTGYNLFIADSREVFADRDGRSLPTLAWQWWVLLAALCLLLLLLFLMRGMDEDKLGIIQKCFIAAILLHLMGTIIASLVWLSNEVIQEIAKVEDPEVMVAVDAQMAAEIDVKLSARQQEAELPVQAPSMQQTNRQQTQKTMQSATAKTQELNLPTTQAAPSESSMVVPKVAQQKTKPTEFKPTPAKPVTTAEAFKPKFMPDAVKPLAAVAFKPTVNTQAPTESAKQQQQTVPKPDAAQPVEVKSQPTEATTKSIAQSAPANKATSTPETAQSAPAAPNSPSVQPEISQQLKTQRFTQNTPAAPQVSEAGTTAPKRTVEHSQSQAESSDVQTPAAQAAPNSLATSTNSSTAKSTPTESLPTANTAKPSGVVVESSLAFEAPAVKSDSPTGPTVPQNTTNVAQFQTTTAKGQAKAVDVSTPAAQVKTDSLEQAADQTFARPNTEYVELKFTAKIEKPSLETELTQSTPIKSQKSADAPESDAPSKTLAQRVANNTAAPAQKAVEAGPSKNATAPAKPSSKSLAAQANPNTVASSPAEKIASNIQSPSSVEFSFNTPDPDALASKLKTNQPSKSDATSSDATARVTKTSPNAKPTNASASLNTDAAGDSASSPTKRTDADATSLATNSASTAKTSTTSSELASIAGPTFDAATSPLDINLQVDPTKRLTGKQVDAPTTVEPNAKPSLARANNTKKPASDFTDSQFVTADSLISPTALAAGSLTADQLATNLAAKSSSATDLPESTLLLQPLGGTLGPSAFATPDALFQRSPEQRKKLIDEFGGSKTSEEAVARALAYLARQQQDDGRWTLVNWNDSKRKKRGRDKHDAAFTGLASLCFLAADHKPGVDGPYKETITKAIDYLVSRQQPNGDLRAGGLMYDQGIASLAVAETALLTGNPKYRDAAIKAAGFIIKSQHKNTGGWRYSPNESGDTSVFGWQVMALHSISQLGFEIPEKTNQGMHRWLKIVTQKGTLLSGYTSSSPKHAMTGEAAYGRILLGQQFTDKQVKQFDKYIMGYLPGKIKPDYYGWYYCTLALNQMQGSAWKQWNDKMRPYFEKSQHIGGDLDGAWKTNTQWASRGGTIYSTSMACLSLQVYYRYLPMYKGNKTDEK